MRNKKIVLFALIGLTLTFITGIAFYSTMAELMPVDYVIYAGIGSIVLFSIIAIFKQLRDEKKGLVTEDELSRKIKQKAAANSFTASIYLWTMILLFTMDSNIGNEILLGIGIVGMGLIFIGFWLYHNNKGIESENPN